MVNRNGMFLSVQEFNQKFIINLFYFFWGGGGVGVWGGVITMNISV